MPKTYQCSKCDQKHARPVGRKCNITDRSDVSVNNSEFIPVETRVGDFPKNSSHSSTPAEPDLNTKLEIIAKALIEIKMNQTNISKRLDKLEKSPDRSRSSEGEVWESLMQSHEQDNGCSPILKQPALGKKIPTPMARGPHEDPDMHIAT